MNFLNLEYFLVAAEELNFTKAAKKLFISQQSLSNHISKLEEYFHADLFDRTPPLSLTNEGHCLVKHAKEMLRIKDDAQKEIRDMRNFQSGILNIGSPHSWGRLLLPYILPKYAALYPNIEIHLEEGTPPEITSKLSSGTLDLGFGFMPDECKDFEVTILCNERILFLTPYSVIYKTYPENADYIIDTMKQKPDISLIKHCPFLISNKTSRTGIAARNIFRYLEITPNIILESRNLEMLLQLCLRGMGCMFCPETFVSEALTGRNSAAISELGIYELPYPNLNRAIAISYNKRKYITQASREFIRLAKESVNNGPFNLGKLI